MENHIKLTAEQQRVVEIRKGTHYIIAPPGSGKTELLSQWITNLLKEGVDEQEIICLTFTIRAAIVMRERINQYHPNMKIMVGNIHHYCSNFLFKNQLVGRHRQIIDGDDQINLFQEIMDDLNLRIVYKRGYSTKDVKAGDMIRINTWFNQSNLNIDESLRSSDNIVKVLNEENMHKVSQVCSRYEQLKKNYHLLDFDDILNLTYHYLDQKDKVYQMAHYSWVEVDEVQDLTPLQHAIIENISQGSTKLFFGDPSQSIFSFIGAKHHNFLSELEKVKKEDSASIHTLQTNFRSPDYLQKVFNTYQDHNFPSAHVLPQKSFITTEELPAMATCIRHINSQYANFEQQFIVNKIIPWLIQQEDRRTAILVRTNNEASEIESYFKEKALPYFMISGKDFFSRRDIKDAMALMSILIDPIDYVSWSRVISRFISGMTLKQSRRFIKDLQECGMSPDEIGKDRSVIDVIRYNISLKNDTLVVFDTETTGKDASEADIIQLAAVRMKNGEVIGEFNRYIDTDKSLESTQEIHQISRQVLDQKGESPQHVFEAFCEFVEEGDILVAHNIAFDMEALNTNIERRTIDIPHFQNDCFDTLSMARKIYPTEKSYRLEYLIERFDLEGVNSHDALDDVHATCSFIRHTEPRVEILSQNLDQWFAQSENIRIVQKITEEVMNIYQASKIWMEREMDILEYIEGVIGDGMYIDSDIDLEKWFNHIAYITKDKSYKNLKEALYDLIPFYRSCKEVDLYFGKEDVLISTIHKAKGLEFDNVIIPNVSSQKYPTFYEVNNEGEKEAARLLYVGITRAKKRLILTYCGDVRSLSSFCAKTAKLFNRRSIEPEQIL
ncbi:UvrD-helicase domain-containing protein [Halosquirtibacter laminarini]|uniref:UvrD-helicase domain-containing protein n=1 Tax=Halosquirtibacter laminarini TaxID=3374600 RepID=A0AC61NQS2_9BACT|nr:UvrD-helicase domain-containing protein [Prolixibacteraceae bacterium]